MKKLMLTLVLLAAPLLSQATVIPFDATLPVSATPQPPANVLDFIPSTCEVLNADFVIDTSIISTSFCDAGIFTASAATIAANAVRVGNIAASTSSQAHAYVMQKDAAPFTLNSLSVKSYATPADQKINQWVVDAVKSDGSSLTYQFPGATTSFTFVDMQDVVYLHVYSFRGAFDLYNLDVTATPIVVPTPVPTATPSPVPTPRKHRNRDR
jgi:hypothetical protein